MATSFNELVNSYVPAPAAASSSVTAPAPDFYQMAAQTGTGLGGITTGGLELDLQTLSVPQMRAKYGSSADGIINQRLQGAQQFQADRLAAGDRSGLGIAGDLTTGVATGFLSSLANIGALGLGAVNTNAGTWAAEKIGQGNEWVQENLQTEGLAAARRVQAAKTALDERDNLAQEKIDIADGMPSWAAGLKRIGNDFLDGVGNATGDVTMASQGTAEAVGSLLGGGPIAKGLKVAGKGVLSAIGRDVLAQTSRIANAGRTLAMPTAIGAMEAGGAYQQSVDDVLKMKHSDLMKNSPDYAALINSGVSEKDARAEIANRTGLMAAAIQGPIAAATGSLVAKFEANPFAVPSVRQALTNIAVKEPIEEAIQSGTGQLAQNIATQQIADTTKDIKSGIGTQSAQGAVYGFTAAGVVQSPGIAAQSARNAASATMQVVKGAKNSLIQRGDNFIRDMDKASPVADATVAAEAVSAAQHAPDVAESIKAEVRATEAAPEAVAKAEAYVDNMMSHLTVSEAEIADPNLPDNVRNAFGNTSNRVEVIQQLAKDIVQSNDTDERLESAYFLLKQMERIESFRMAEASALNELSKDSPSRVALNQYQNLIADVLKTPGVRSAVLEVRSMMDEVQQEAVTDESIQTPEGQKAADNIITVAEAAPTSSNVEAIDSVLNQDAKGTLNLTNDQRASLKVARALVDAINNSKAQNASDVVHGELIAFKDQGSKGPSLAQLSQAVLRQYRNGDTEAARGNLSHLRDLAQHMQNKVEALNTHLATGDFKAPRVPYQQLRQDGSWGKSSEQHSMYVNTRSEKSIAQAQRIAQEANVLGSVYNTLAEATGLGQPVVVNQLASITSTPAPVTNVTKAEPKAQPEPQQTKPAEVVAEVQPVAENLSPMQQVYPDLYVAKHQTENLFIKSFDLPTEATTHTIGEDSPLEFVQRALSNTNELRKVADTNKELDTNTARDYKAYLSSAPEIAQTLQNNLKKFLNSRYSKDNAQKIGDLYLNNGVVDSKQGKIYMGRFNTSQRGKLLNIVEDTADGLQYNQKLLESAVLAGLQWVLSSKNYGQQMDADDVLDMTGATNLSPEAIDALSTGLSELEVADSLGNQIRSYWGLTTNPDAPIGLTDGIIQSMAAEVLRGLQDVGLVHKISVDLDETDGLDGPRTFNRYIAEEVSSQMEGLKKFPQAIDHAVLVNPIEANFIGEDAVVPVATTQMNNPKVKNTPDQIKVIEFEQKNKFTFNETMMNIYRGLGEQNIVNLFGVRQRDGEVFNKNHAKTVEGKNRSIVAAYNHLMDLFAQTGDYETPVKFGVNFSRVNRMQMLGKYNPQSNKLVRESLLSTWDTVDLSNTGSKDYSAFILGIGQAFGVKIHNMSRADVATKVEGILKKMEPIADLIGSLSSGKHVLDGDEAQLIKDTFKDAGADLGPVGLHAYSEWIRLQNTKDRKKFRTAVYVEADGMTNGPINAMGLYSAGSFTKTWVENIGKGGLFFQKDMTANTYRSKIDTQDLYQATTNALSGFMSDFRNSLSNNPEIIEQQNHVLNLMHEFMPGDVIFDSSKDFDNGGLKLSRNITKNPLTITIYGSGQAGIANNVAGKIVKAIYERMTQAAQAQAEDSDLSMIDALFNGDTVRGEKFLAAMDALLYTTATKQEDQWVINDNRAQTKLGNVKNAVDFTISGAEFKNLQKNFQSLFVGQMHQAIAQTVGSDLLDNVTVMRKVGQAHSIILKDAYQRAVKEALEAKKTTAEYNPTLFLSRNELNKIDRKMGDLQPYVSTGSQTYYTAGKSRQDLVSSPFGGGLDGSLRVKSPINAPDNSRVAIIPFMTIGQGDGMMMQELSLNQNIQNTLKIFDGMNIPLSKIDQYSLEANRAVSKSWEGNPFRDVAQSFSKIDIAKAVNEMTEEGQFELASALVGPYKAEAMTASKIIAELELQAGLLTSLGNMVETRHATLKKVTTSLDQMASAGAPFQNTGIDIVGTDAQSIADQLNAVQAGKIKAPVKVEDFRKVGRAHSSGAQVLSYTALKNLTKSLKFSDSQKVMFDEIMRSQAAKDYKVVYGTPEQITAYQQANGLTVTPASMQGSTSIAEKTIYLFNQSPETLVHELIHAASFENVLSFYEGRANEEVSDAVKRIEALKEQFLAEDVTNVEQIAARAAILDGELGLDAMAKAKSLNEFMAWGLTNNQMTEAAKKKQAPSLAQIATKVVKAIKQLIWGRKKAPAYADDALSSLQFNTGVVIRSAATQMDITRRAVLNQNQIYNSTDRVEALGEMFSDKVAAFAKASNNLGAQAKLASITADQLNTAVEVAFPMNKKASYTFSNIAAALATSMDLDPAVLARAQELYTHVTKNITVEMFKDPNAVDPQTADYEASQKYDLIMGKSYIGKDSLGRSTLMPAFVALGMVDDGFRSVLESIESPAKSKFAKTSLNDAIDSIGNMGVQYISDKLTSDRNSKNVRESLDSLMGKLYEQNIENDSYIDQAMASTGSYVDAGNEFIRQGIESLSGKVTNAADDLAANSKNPLVRKAAKVVSMTASLATEAGAEVVSKGVVDMLNTNNVWRPFRDLMKDIVGRTDSNADVYDMIKYVRSMVQQIRQQFRENVPQIIASKFTRELSKREWSDMHAGLGKTDVAALFGGMRSKDILNVLHDAKAMKSAMDARIDDLSKHYGSDWNKVNTKAKQLATFMVTGQAGNNLLRNAYAVGNLFGEQKSKQFVVPNQKQVQSLDELISLYALDMQSQSVKDSIANLAQTEGEGMEFAMAYLRGQRRSELTKQATNNAMVNRFKGYIPTMAQESAQIIVADDADFAKLKARSYERIGNYAGSSIEQVGHRGYYYSPTSGRAMFNQGILQNVRHTTMGVDSVNGFSVGMNNAGRITNPNLVKALAKNLRLEGKTAEPLMPIYNSRGVVVAFERAYDPSMSAKLERDTHFGKMVGVWRGRQVEESKAEQVNNALIDNLFEMYDKAGVDQNQYVNIFNHPDPVIADAVGLFNIQTRNYIEEKFGADTFMVRKDLVEDVTGYRNASIGDAWSGNTRWNQSTIDNAKKMVVGLFGSKAYQYAVNGERILQNFVQDARTVIVVKSVIVPVSNMISNVYQMIGRGIPIMDIAKGFPRKTMEINSYVKSQIRKIEAEAELLASTNPNQQLKLRAEIKSIDDGHKRLSIWPLIEAGEFTAISDAGLTHEDTDITSGRLNSYMETLVDKLPESIRTAGKYAIVSKDTALFQGLQKAIQYGDFIAKAIQYDDFVKRQKKDTAYALGRISEEFVNYDRLPGRFRGYIESIGLLWFYNFKIRSVKVAASMLRNNPLHSMMALALPSQTAFGNVGTPIEDNMISKLGDGSLNYSVGLGQAFRAPFLNPWLNLVN
ncbi:single subunit virion RNA polymerase [Stenotrophomonas phage C121]|uniref:single subunit virion RNA polymerase n=1 Tax=Stenotrophomonas phage C121 TaxID=2914029 RepID=UPI00232974B4|nr:single subunit virion RNA polymerase [Stenotrophomonas phage C121]UKL14807.1 single subunit virion RNA polymerase [Stenotrophomonas phage C121]